MTLLLQIAIRSFSKRNFASVLLPGKKFFHFSGAAFIEFTFFGFQLTKQPQEFAGVDTFFIGDIQQDGFGFFAVDGIDKLRVQSDSLLFGSNHETDCTDQFAFCELCPGFGRWQ